MDCIFCKIINGDIPSYTIYEDDYIKCFLDVNPKSNGHTLIIPKKHFNSIDDIENEYLIKIKDKSKDLMKLIEEKLGADGFEITINKGSLQIVKHFHMHIIPNYKKNKKLSIEEVFAILTK